jgi:hypothetical protein
VRRFYGIAYQSPGPNVNLAVGNAALVSADWAPPHDGIGIRVDIRSDHADAPYVSSEAQGTFVTVPGV